MSLPPLLDRTSILARWNATLASLVMVRDDLANLEQSRTLTYRDVWLSAQTNSVTERNKIAEMDVAPLTAEIHRARCELDKLLDEIAWLKAAAHQAPAFPRETTDAAADR
jgi:hypothetical protein